MNPTFHRLIELFGVVESQSTEETAPAVEVHGLDSEESSILGSQRLSEGDYEAAIAHFRKSVEQSGEKDLSRLLDLGGAYEAAGMEPQALRQYRKALRAKGDAPEPLLGAAQIYKRDAKWNQAITELESALAKEPNNAFYQHKLAEIFRETGHKQKALQAAMAAVATNPADSFYHYWMGELLLEMDRPKDAIQAYRAAIELSPGDDHMILRASIAFWRMGRREEAVKAVRLASDLDPEQLLHYGVLALYLTEMGDVQAALAEKKRAEDMDSYDQDLLVRHAKACHIDLT